MSRSFNTNAAAGTLCGAGPVVQSAGPPLWRFRGFMEVCQPIDCVADLTDMNHFRHSGELELSGVSDTE